MSPRQLIQQCIRHEERAWRELFDIIKRASSGSIKSILRTYGFDSELADDILQDLYLYFRNRNLRCLKSFRGNSLGELAAFLRTIAVRFACRTVRGWQADAIRENSLRKELNDCYRHDGPTEQQVLTALAELRAAMSIRDRQRLALLLHHLYADRTAKRARSARTLRRWKEELFRKYGDLPSIPGKDKSMARQAVH